MALRTTRPSPGYEEVGSWPAASTSEARRRVCISRPIRRADLELGAVIGTLLSGFLLARIAWVGCSAHSAAVSCSSRCWGRVLPAVIALVGALLGYCAATPLTAA
jgi:hypothetical protein